MANEEACLPPYESEHDFRLRMAREGKAIYVPGKTVEEWHAEQAAIRDALKAKTTRGIVLTEGDWSALDTAIPDTLEMVADVRNVFFSLAYRVDLDVPEVNSTMRLVARAVQSFEDKECRALDALDFAIRHSPKGGQS